MSDEGFEEWDAEFLDQLIQVEELALSSSSSNAFPNHQQPLPSLHRRRPEPPPLPPEDSRWTVTHSPPRNLSQRTGRSADDRDLEIEGLKRELGRVSKQLLDLEQECSNLRKERDQKNGRLSNLSSKSDEKDAVPCHSRTENLDTEREAFGVDHLRVSRQSRSTSCCKGTGVQTDDGGIFAQGFLKDDIPACPNLTKKLRDIWDFQNSQTLRGNLISNLLMACQTDLHELFGCIGMNSSMKSRLDSPAYESSSLVQVYPLPSCYSLEASKVSQFYLMLTKFLSQINNGMVHVEALLEPLIDLCSLENVVIIHRSLCILHVFLKLLFHLEIKSGERDNVTVDGLCSGKNILNCHATGAAEKTFSIGGQETSYACSNFPEAKSLFEEQQWNPSVANSVSRVDWVSLFKIMLQIATGKTEECVRIEALSIMNIILIRSNAYTDREKFGKTQVFESISQLLKKEAGLNVQKQSVQLLYLLLNCPELLVTFCCHCTEEECTSSRKITSEDTSASQNFTFILWGLADCIACSDNGLEELKLRRNAIVLLAFLASSGKSGFDILVSHKLSKDTNFLMLIMQVVVSEIDAEATTTPNSPEIFEERTLLMREALILLNRLVSNPAYSASTLQILTKSRDMASMTIYIANRLSRKDCANGLFVGMVGITRKSEVVDLARVFKKRVFAFMGDHV